MTWAEAFYLLGKEAIPFIGFVLPIILVILFFKVIER